MTAQDVIEFLSTCSNHKLVEIFTRSVSNRELNRLSNKYDIEERIALCLAWRYRANSRYDMKGWEIEIVAHQEDSDDDEIASSEDGLWQSGTCSKCNATIRSYSKSVICPLCSNKVSLT